MAEYSSSMAALGWLTLVISGMAAKTGGVCVADANGGTIFYCVVGGLCGGNQPVTASKQYKTLYSRTLFILLYIYIYSTCIYIYKHGSRPLIAYI